MPSSTGSASRSRSRDPPKKKSSKKGGRGRYSSEGGGQAMSENQNRPEDDSLQLKWSEKGKGVEDEHEGERKEIPVPSQDMLFNACRTGKVRMVEKLTLRFRHAAELRDGEMRTPLIIAAQYEHVEVVKYLILHAGAHVNAFDGNRWTALTWAVHHNNMDLVRWLVREGHAESSVRDRLDRSLLSHASVEVGLYLYAGHHTVFSSVSCLHFLKQSIRSSLATPEELLDVAVEGVKDNDSPLSAALTLSWLFKELAKFEPSHKERYHVASQHFDDLASWLFSSVDSDSMAALLLEHGEGMTVPPIETALSTENASFLSHSRVRHIVDSWFQGRAPAVFSRQGVLETKDPRHWMSKDRSQNVVSLISRPMWLFRIPFFQRFLRDISFIAFLVTLLVWVSQTRSVTSDVRLMEYVLYILGAGWLLDEIVEVAGSSPSLYFSFAWNRWSALSLSSLIIIAATRLSGWDDRNAEGVYSASVPLLLFCVFARGLYSIAMFLAPLNHLLYLSGRVLPDLFAFAIVAASFICSFSFMIWFLFGSDGGVDGLTSSYSEVFLLTFQAILTADTDLSVFDSVSPAWRSSLGKAIVSGLLVLGGLVLVSLLLAMLVSTYLASKDETHLGLSMRHVRDRWNAGLQIYRLPSPLNLISALLFLIIYPFFIIIRSCRECVCPADEPVFLAEEINTLTSNSIGSGGGRGGSGGRGGGDDAGSELEVVSTQYSGFAELPDNEPTHLYCIYCSQYEKDVEVRQRRALLVSHSQQQLKLDPMSRSASRHNLYLNAQKKKKKTTTGVGSVGKGGKKVKKSEYNEAKVNEKELNSTEMGRLHNEGSSNISLSSLPSSSPPPALNNNVDDSPESNSKLPASASINGNIDQSFGGALDTRIDVNKIEAYQLEHLYTYGAICECGRTKRFRGINRFLFERINTYTFCVLLWPVLVRLLSPSFSLSALFPSLSLFSFFLSPSDYFSLSPILYPSCFPLSMFLFAADNLSYSISTGHSVSPCRSSPGVLQPFLEPAPWSFL